MKRLLYLYICVCCSLPLCAQQDDYRQLLRMFMQVSRFDYNYPREKVYLHLDNNAYLEGETMWFKAYVVRASSLRPTTLSRVLYVELLNADGELVERKLLRVENGQAHGEFNLDLPVRQGFYEVRAYTREMLNWGEEACFSRVVPIFQRPERDGDYSNLTIRRPETPADLNYNHQRQFRFAPVGGYNMTFYPEGGSRAAGLSQRIAYLLTDRRGNPLSGISCSLYADNGTLLKHFVPEFEGMGSLNLPAVAGRAYVMVGEGSDAQRFDLPEPTDVPYSMEIRRLPDGLSVLVQRRESVEPRLLGLLVTCRDEACYFDTLTVSSEPIELGLDTSVLREGVNNFQLFDAEGNLISSRLVFNYTGQHHLSVNVRQNENSYDAFSPIALEMNVTDSKGAPVQTTFSIAVREGGGELAAPEAGGSEADLLLSSELKGYVAHPEKYFDGSDPQATEHLDLLLMVQGWRANAFATMCGAEPFERKQPIEENLTLNGRVLKDNDKGIARAGVQLDLVMFTKNGDVLRSSATTDSLGQFAFVSNVDYEGDWVAQFSTKVKGKPRWSRVALDRWFGLTPREFDVREMNVEPPLKTSENAEADNVKTFAWTDTIPRIVSTTIGEAKVIVKNKYKGLIGNRYSFEGGEQAGMRRASFYYDMETEVDRTRDNGGSVGLIWDELQKKDPLFAYSLGTGAADSRYVSFLNLLGDSASEGADTNDYEFTYAGVPALLFIDNDLALKNRTFSPYIWADEVKSVVVMRQQTDWEHFLPSHLKGKGDELSRFHATAIFVYTRPDYKYFRSGKGIEKRTVHGYSEPRTFTSPSYRGLDMPSPDDRRRTLYWNPCLTTDATGNASAVFFSNSYENQQLRISLRGVSNQGKILNYER